MSSDNQNSESTWKTDQQVFIDRITQEFNDRKAAKQKTIYTSKIFEERGIDTQAAELYTEWNFEGGFDNSNFTAAKPKTAFSLKHLSRMYYQLDHIIFPLVFDVKTAKETLPKLNEANIWSCYLYFLEDNVLLHSKSAFTRMLESFEDPNRQAGNRKKYKKVLAGARVDDRRFLVKELEGEENNPNHKDVLKMLKVVRERESLLESLVEDGAELLNPTAGVAHSPRTDYTVGWICALPVELVAAVEMMGKEHQVLPQDPTDTNSYSFGRIGEHNVVVACLPAGQLGISSAAAVASQMKSRFPSIRFGLMVGIGGGVPSAEADIRLGDVVISQPVGEHGGVVQYDFGKTGLEGRFTRTGSLNAPPTILLAALAKLRSNCI